LSDKVCNALSCDFISAGRRAFKQPLPFPQPLLFLLAPSITIPHFVCLHASISFTFSVFASLAFCTRHRTQLIYQLEVGTPSPAPHCCILSCRVAASPTPRLVHLVPGSASITTSCYLSALYCQNALSKQMLNNFSATHRNTPCCLSLYLYLSLSLSQ